MRHTPPPPAPTTPGPRPRRRYQIGEVLAGTRPAHSHDEITSTITGHAVEDAAAAGLVYRAPWNRHRHVVSI